MNIKRLAIAAFVLAMPVAVWLGYKVQQLAEPSGQLREFLGDEMVAVLQNAERIESFRVRPATLNEIHKGDQIAARSKILAVGPELNGRQVAHLKAILLDDNSYVWDSAKVCAPRPAVLLRVHHRNSYVDVAICLECSMWAFSLNSDAPPFSRKWEDFDPVAKKRAALAVELFPDDEALKQFR